ncbi:MAG: DNA polymerase III subunit delta [Lentisphaerae bacterium]|nr:DNA polymerase III subunit delta [Lentisphaerota bacterium]
MAACVYLIYGEDEYRVSAKASAIMDGLAPASDMMSREVIEADAANADEVAAMVGSCLEALQTSGLFSSSKAVWLRGATFLGTAQVARSESAKTAVGRLTALLKSGLPAEQSLVVSATGCDKRSAFYKACKEVGEIHEFAPSAKASMVEREAVDFAASRFAAAGVRAGRAVVQSFVARVGLDSRLIVSEVDKLVAYIGARETVKPADVEAITSASREAAGWDLADAVGRRDLVQALNVLRQLLFQREPHIMLIRGIENRISLLQLYREAINKRWLVKATGHGGGDAAEWRDLPPEIDRIMSEDLLNDPRKGHPYRRLLMAQQAARFSSAELESCRQAVLEAHTQLVSSRVPPDTVMELLLVRMVGDRG